MPSYQTLKREYQKDKVAFTLNYSLGNARLQAIRVLAHTKHDNGWPLGMLHVLAPELAPALEEWTAGGYEAIRLAQDEDRVRPGSPADMLLKHFPDLPLWRGTATHVSKSADLFDRIRNERGLTLTSFMGCCAPLHTFAHVSNPKATLRFTKLRTARLVGGLSTEGLEREVLLPAGARFILTKWNMAGRVLTLHETSA